jgi:hypothetical protein
VRSGPGNPPRRPRERRFGTWCAAAFLTALWTALLGLLLQPAPRLSPPSAAAPPRVVFLPPGRAERDGASVHAVWSPVLFSLPSPAGFSRPFRRAALTPRATGEIFSPERVSAEGGPPEASPPSWLSPAAEAPAPARITPRAEEPPPPPLPPLTVALERGLAECGVRRFDLPDPTGPGPWSASAAVRFDSNGIPASVLFDPPPPDPAYAAALAQALYRWRADPGRSPCRGRITIRRDGGSP